MEDLVGNKFNRWTVQSYNRKDNSATYWNCVCECGKEGVVTQSNLLRGHSTSCGCTRKKAVSESIQKMHPREWSSWENMHQRCFNENHHQYDDWGGRGIGICPEWNRYVGGTFDKFYEDMGIRPEGMSIERIDLNLDYCKENCKWDTDSNQSYNRRKFKNNTTGRTGVSFNKRTGKYQVSIGVNGKQKSLGYYEDFELACFVREEAELTYYGYIKE